MCKMISLTEFENMLDAKLVILEANLTKKFEDSLVEIVNKNKTDIDNLTKRIELLETT